MRRPRLPRTASGCTGLALVTLLALLAVLAPMVWGDAATRFDPSAIGEGASAAHPLGTDALGRDLLARTLVATRFTLLLALLATAIGTGIGLVLGTLPSVLPRRAGQLVTSAVNALVAFPGLLLAMFTAVIAGLGAPGAVLGIGVATAPAFARLTNSLAVSIATSDYVLAARMMGVPRHRILLRHVVPNIAEPLVMTCAQAISGALLGLAGLSFLGLGVQPPSYDWGRLLFDAFGHIYVTPVVAVGPAVAIVLAGLGFALLGDSFSDAAARRSAAAGGSDKASSATGISPAEPQQDGSGTVEGEPDAVLDVRGLTVTFPGGLRPVRDLSLTIRQGEIVGLLGESGSGKSMTASAIGGLVPHPGRVDSRRLRLDGQEVNSLAENARRKLLGTSLAMIFQDPMASLNPALRVGGQLAEVSVVHQGATRADAWQRAVDRLGSVRLPDPERTARMHPHQLSGGMRQRAVIAMGLMGAPRLIIADEPTTALDVTVQRQILKLLREVTDETGAGVLFITHDIALAGELCDRVAVMYAGAIVEELETSRLADGAVHPYTRALLGSVPTMDTDRHAPLTGIPGTQPSPAELGPGCTFADRCASATDRCRTERPVLVEHGAGHRAACWEAS
ncbi:dipeptide/oligopeptide/nickel ABC transporter permease/ATP-binding protein [Streptomyces sp. NPDC087440]|uniref:dipeptide/oligopeptide/nickel ABC transporter permease/ATP-binding protein n=1 Tax=Streptomyces sp. NPDC087440 TaxID=3365790 RepID=UPI003825EA0A